jgi:hypothetical protein
MLRRSRCLCMRQRGCGSAAISEESFFESRRGPLASGGQNSKGLKVAETRD